MGLIHRHKDYANAVPLAVSYRGMLFLHVVLMWRKMPPWWDKVRWRTEARWCGIRLLLIFWYHVRRRITCFQVMADRRWQKPQKVERSSETAAPSKSLTPFGPSIVPVPKREHPGEDQRSWARSCVKSVRTEDMEDTAGNTKEGLK